MSKNVVFQKMADTLNSATEKLGDFTEDVEKNPEEFSKKLARVSLIGGLIGLACMLKITAKRLDEGGRPVEVVLQLANTDGTPIDMTTAQV